MGLLQLIGWLAYPVFFPVPLLALNCLAAWLLARGQETYEALPVPPPLWTVPRVWFALAVLSVTTYVVGGSALLAWQLGFALAVWVSLPMTMCVLILLSMRRAHSASRLTRPGVSGLRRDL